MKNLFINFLFFIFLSNFVIGQDTKWSEESLKNYWQTNSIDEFEGIYLAAANPDPFVQGVVDKNKYPPLKLGLVKEDSIYRLVFLGGIAEKFSKNWKVGDTKAILKSTYFYGGFETLYYNGNKEKAIWASTFFNQNNTVGILTDFVFFYPKKIYPEISEKLKLKYDKISEANGIVINSKGIIAANFKQVKYAKKITVIININGIIEEFNAKVIENPMNLAGLKDEVFLQINDDKFKGFGPLQYLIEDQYSTNSLNLEKVFAFNYNDKKKIFEIDTLILDRSKRELNGIPNIFLNLKYQPQKIGAPIFNNHGTLIGHTVSNNSNDFSKTLISLSSNWQYFIKRIPEFFGTPTIKEYGDIDNSKRFDKFKDFIVRVKVEY